jgi:hypothetical protein
MRTTRWCPTHLSVVLVVSGSVFACQPDAEIPKDPSLIRDSTYIEVMADLMLLEAAPPAVDSAQDREVALDSLRREILSGHGVTPEQVLDFARVTGSEAGRMEALWQSITQRYDSVRVARLQTEGDGTGGPESSAAGDGTVGEEPGGAAAQDPTGSGVARRAADSTRSPGASTRPGLKPGGRPPARRPTARDTTDGSR